MLWSSLLETRWRFVFILGSILLVWVAPLWLPSTGGVGGGGCVEDGKALQLESALLYIFAAIYLAGAGSILKRVRATTAFMVPCCSRCLCRFRGRLLLVRAGLVRF